GVHGQEALVGGGAGRVEDIKIGPVGCGRGQARGAHRYQRAIVGRVLQIQRAAVVGLVGAHHPDAVDGGVEVEADALGGAAQLEALRRAHGR
nr:hypothetical protein [Tanacetum cinerariifolium]